MRRAYFEARIIVLLLLVGGGLLSGCSSWYASLEARLTPSPSPSSLMIETTPVPAAAYAAETGTPPVQVECAYVWSSRSLPDLSTEVNKAFRDQGLAGVQVGASAYGEDCLDSQTNTVVHFTAKQTDFYVTVPLDTVSDPQEMGEWVETVLQVLGAFPPGTAPGPDPGYVGITFTNGTETASLWFTRARGTKLIEEGLRGGELYDSLVNDQ